MSLGRTERCHACITMAQAADRFPLRSYVHDLGNVLLMTYMEVTAASSDQECWPYG